jgi:ribonuclease HI
MGEWPFNISIVASKENSMHKAKNADKEIQVFSDGSVLRGKVGAAAVLIRKDRPDRILHYHLGPETKHTVHEAELVGIVLALHLISTEKCNATSCSIMVDNQATLKAFASDMHSLGHHLVHEFLLLVNCLLKSRNKHKFGLTLRWTVGHCGIPGNEKADREAKKAAGGITLDTKTLPLYLRKPLLTNPAAAKRKFNDNLIKRWKSDWTKST